MTDQTKAPERIWAYRWTKKSKSGQWFPHKHPFAEQDYVRADIAAEQVREAYERAAQIVEAEGRKARACPEELIAETYCDDSAAAIRVLASQDKETQR